MQSRALFLSLEPYLVSPGGFSWGDRHKQCVGQAQLKNIEIRMEPPVGWVLIAAGRQAGRQAGRAGDQLGRQAGRQAGRAGRQAGKGHQLHYSLGLQQL